MVTTYLGQPPEHIKKWINEHTTGGSSPTEKPERWVDAEYTNDWIFSDGETYTTPQYTDDPDGVYRWAIDTAYWGVDSDDPSKDGRNEEAVSFQFLNSTGNKVTAYRKYTPGHWENEETGEWINGSWSAWDDSDHAPVFENGRWKDAIRDYDFEYDFSNPFLSYPEQSEASNLIYDISGSTIIRRTWNNTKDAPSA